MTEPGFTPSFDLRAQPWADAEPTRLARDRREISEFDSSLQYHAAGTMVGDTVFRHGGWFGILPLWPFDRPSPAGLDALTGGRGLECAVSYRAAYPMVPPTVRPLSPEPEIVERTQATWHVLPSGGLCLLQSDGAWLPEVSIVELLLRAAGWRVEYALMKASVIDAMAVSGIVSDPSYDHLVTVAAEQITQPTGTAQSEEG